MRGWSIVTSTPFLVMAQKMGLVGEERTKVTAIQRGLAAALVTTDHLLMTSSALAGIL
jgi:hypothetical protein